MIKIYYFENLQRQKERVIHSAAIIVLNSPLIWEKKSNHGKRGESFLFLDPQITVPSPETNNSSKGKLQHPRKYLSWKSRKMFTVFLKQPKFYCYVLFFDYFRFFYSSKKAVLLQRSVHRFQLLLQRIDSGYPACNQHVVQKLVQLQSHSFCI